MEYHLSSAFFPKLVNVLGKYKKAVSIKTFMFFLVTGNVPILPSFLLGFITKCMFCELFDSISIRNIYKAKVPGQMIDKNMTHTYI